MTDIKNELVSALDCTPEQAQALMDDMEFAGIEGIYSVAPAGKAGNCTLLQASDGKNNYELIVSSRFILETVRGADGSVIYQINY